MRPIKFRGWHTTQKRMFSAEEMAADQLTLLTTGSFINVDGASTRLSIIYPSDQFVPLQFTGLTDKNDKEIYEGDVVVIPDSETERILDDGSGPAYGTNHLAEVIFGKGCFKFKITESADCLSAGKYTYDRIEDEVGIEELEVIGNIYENPELLKKSANQEENDHE